MPVELCTVGGYSEIGRNMTALKYKNEVILFDMGLHMESYIAYTEEDPTELKSQISAKKLLDIGAVPNIEHIEDWRKQVIAIIPSHAHLDHIGAIPFLANRFRADIICTPFVKAVL